MGYTENHGIFIAHEIYGGPDFQVHGVIIPYEDPMILP